MVNYWWLLLGMLGMPDWGFFLAIRTAARPSLVGCIKLRTPIFKRDVPRPLHQPGLHTMGVLGQRRVPICST